MEEVLDLPLPEAADGAAPKAQSVPDENQILSHVPHFDKRERVASVSVLHSAPLPLGYEKHNETRGLYPVFAEHFANFPGEVPPLDLSKGEGSGVEHVRPGSVPLHRRTRR